MLRRNDFGKVLLFLAPALALYVVFIAYPTLRGLYLSVTEYSGVGEATFVGFEHYRNMVRDSEVIRAVINTVLYAVMAVIAQNLLGLAFARALASFTKLRNVLRVLLFTPSMIAALIAAYVWSVIYSPLGGGLNTLLDQFGLGALKQVWLGNPDLALAALAVVQVWMFAGQTAAIYLAGYLSIPHELFDAAAIDGASGWQKFSYIEWPLLAPAATVSITLCTIGSLKVFELPLIMTNGGPSDATLTLGLLIYRTAFSGNQFGYGAAIAIIMLVLIVATAAIQVTVLRSREGRL